MNWIRRPWVSRSHEPPASPSEGQGHFSPLSLESSSQGPLGNDATQKRRIRQDGSWQSGEFGPGAKICRPPLTVHRRTDPTPTETKPSKSLPRTVSDSRSCFSNVFPSIRWFSGNVKRMDSARIARKKKTPRNHSIPRPTIAKTAFSISDIGRGNSGRHGRRPAPARIPRGLRSGASGVTAAMDPPVMFLIFHAIRMTASTDTSFDAVHDGGSPVPRFEAIERCFSPTNRHARVRGVTRRSCWP